MLNKSFSINLNFDSLGEAYGWPNNYKDDKAFSNGIRRIIKTIQKYNIPVTFFIVGKDLENKKNFEIIKRLSDNDNVEIANHTYNHLFNFGSRNKSIIYNEIYKSSILMIDKNIYIIIPKRVYKRYFFYYDALI